MEVCPCMVSCCKQILYSFKKNCPNGCPCPEHDCDYYTTTPFPTEPITGGTRPTFLPWINSLKDETFSKHWDRIFFRVSTVTRYFDPRTSSSLFSPLSCLVSQSPSKTKMLLLILLVSVQANVQKEKFIGYTWKVLLNTKKPLIGRWVPPVETWEPCATIFRVITTFL